MNNSVIISIKDVFEVKYYFCLIISLAALFVTSSGFYFTNTEQKEPRFTVLVSFPLAAICFMVFSPLSLWLSVFITSFLFIALLVIGEAVDFAGPSCYHEYTGRIPYELPQKKWKSDILMWGILSIVPIAGFCLCLIFEGWLAVAWVYGGLLLLFGVVAVINIIHYEFFETWATPFLGYAGLGTILAIIGYAAIARFGILTFWAIATFSGFIGLHFTVDGLKEHGFYRFFNPVHGIGWCSSSVYRGASPIPLGLALAAAVGFSFYIMFYSFEVAIASIILSTICYGIFVYLPIFERWIWSYGAVVLFIIGAAALFPLFKWVISLN